VKNAAPTKKDAVADVNMSAQESVVRDDHAISDPDIVSEVSASHQKAVVSDGGLRVRNTPSVNGDVLTKFVSAADPNPTDYTRLEGEVLRVATDDRSITDQVVGAHLNGARNDSVGLNDTTIANSGRTLDHCIGSDRDIAAELGLRMNYGSSMNHEAYISCRLISFRSSAL
jgi:hypothetical protein